MSWNNLTDRQRYLDNAIEQCGIKLDYSDTCLHKVMNAIGASSSERIYVKQRIELRLYAADLLNKTDDFISNTEQMLDQFEKDDEEWRKKGQSFGFNL